MERMDDFITAAGEVDYGLLDSCKAPSSLCEYGGKVQPVVQYTIQDYPNSPPRDHSSSPNSQDYDTSLPVEYLEEHIEQQETISQSDDDMNYFLPPLHQPWTECLDKVGGFFLSRKKIDILLANNSVRQCPLPIRRIITWQGFPRQDSGRVQCLASD